MTSITLWLFGAQGSGVAPGSTWLACSLRTRTESYSRWKQTTMCWNSKRMKWWWLK